MNILYITPLYSPATGGAATHALNLGRAVSRNDQIDSFHILTEANREHPESDPLDKVTVHRLLPRRISRSRKFWLHHISSYCLTQIWFFFNLKRFLLEHEIQVIHFHSRYGNPFFLQLCKSFSIAASVADVQDRFFQPDRLASSTDHIVCNCRGIGEFIASSHTPSNLYSIIPGIFNPPARLESREAGAIRECYNIPEDFILFAGDINRNKGIIELIDACEPTAERIHWPPLVIAGTNRMGRVFEVKIRNNPSILFLGPIPHSHALALMQQAKLVALPSRSEGLPWVILEAVALGTKVLCPPNIPEFEAYLPEFVLPEVTVDSIRLKMEVILHIDIIPEYPFQDHDEKNIITSLVRLYSTLIPGGPG